MNNELIAKYIREYRKKKNLTQAELAGILGVTYQAVSKWENCKSSPDIDILKKISEIMHVNIEIFFNEKKHHNMKLLIIISIIFIIIIALIIIFLGKNNNFEFKTISTTCSDFEISGSAAYNKEKSAIYISSINYCGKEDTEKYKYIECDLYEERNNNKVLISSCENGNEIELTDYLKTVKITVSNYLSMCPSLTNANLYLEIKAADEKDNVTLHTIPLTFNESC